MPCLCQFFNKNKHYHAIESSTKSNSDRTATISQGQVSASELVQLKAEVWSLRNSLSDSVTANNNMQDAITQAVAEKYELLEQLTMANNESIALESQHQQERNVHCQERDKFLREIASYRAKIKELSYLVDIISEQNIELKKSLLETNDTICKMGHKYLKLKLYLNNEEYSEI